MTDQKLIDIFDESRRLDPALHGKLGAHVGGGNPLVPLLARYVVASTFQVPTSCNRDYPTLNYGMLANDNIGDCVIAELYHKIMHMHQGVKKPVPNPTVLTPLVVEVYSAITGYVPGDDTTDNGTDPAQAYAYWKHHGLPWPDPSGKTALHHILGLAQVLPHDGANLMRGIYEFDGAGLSLALPLAWQQMDIWDAGGDPQKDPNWQAGGWGGHQVLGVSYDSQHIAIITWGGIKLMTWRGWGTYGELALVAVTQDQIGSGVSETGLDLKALSADIGHL